MDEATQFTEMEFRVLGGCLRGVNNIPKRFYLTCNPGKILPFRTGMCVKIEEKYWKAKTLKAS